MLYNLFQNTRLKERSRLQETDDTHHIEAVEVVNISVLPAVRVHRIFMHRNLGAVEHARLIHVVPSVNILTGALVVFVVELRCPPASHVSSGKVGVRGGPCNGQMAH